MRVLRTPGTSSKKPPRPPVSVSKTVPAPVGGWNARDPLANMAVMDAVIMDNVFPRTGDVQMRKGSSDHVTGLLAQVNSLMTYAGPTASSMFAASNTAIYDVTTAGAVGAAVYTGLTNTKFNHINIRTSGGSFLFAVNGADLAVQYNGSSWSNPSITGLDVGMTTANFSHINMWKRRVFLVEKDSMSVWYLGVDSISGAASEINFGPLFKKGGKVVATATWTIDGGEGVDDYFVIITSRGEVAVYLGTDPSAAATFALKGVYELGSPVGDGKCFVKYGSDLILITLDGFVPMSKALTSTRTDERIAISDKISGAVASASTLYQNNFGWHPILFSGENMILFNVPVSEGVEAHQYVMNTLTGAWCRFTGWNANCFELLNDGLYFGMNGKVCKAWDGTSDSGTAVSADVLTAFNYFDILGQNKQFVMARPILTASDLPAPTLGLNVDFQIADVTYTATIANPYGAWDSGLWDAARWGGGTATYNDWQTVQGIGFCAALRFKISSTTIELTWAATDFVFMVGATI